MKIASIHGRQILDSRGNPTVEADVILENGVLGRAAVPSGASTGIHEAVELRDGDAEQYQGKSVMRAVRNITAEIERALKGFDIFNQRKIDKIMITLDGTEQKSRLGANAILAVSLAAAKSAAAARAIPLFEYIAELGKQKDPRLLPVPLMNIINGGRHAAGSTDIQEFMIAPVGATRFSDALHMGVNVFHMLKNVLHEKGYGTTVGDEGGYAPSVEHGNEEAIELIAEAIKRAGYVFGEDIVLALDVAASELYKNGEYHLAVDKKILGTQEMIDWLDGLRKKYPIVSIEDGLAESDWDGWQGMTRRIPIQLVGDDLLVTNIKFLKKAIELKAGNAILVKPNQIGTLTETIDVVQMAKRAGWKTIVSHRSGETEETTIAHLAVGLGTGQIKTGSLSRTDRVAKYNELLRIEEQLGKRATYNGSIFLK